MTRLPEGADIVQQAEDYFRRGFNIREVRGLLELETAYSRHLSVIRKRVVAELDPKELANGSILRCDKRTDFGRRARVKPEPIEQTSILDIVDGHMNVRRPQ